MNAQIAEYHDFFLAGAGVAGALIGLLFVALSVSQERIKSRDGVLHRVRAAAALTAFTNIVVICLLGLIPGQDLGAVSAAVGSAGIFFLVGAGLSLRRARWSWALVRDLGFLLALAAVFTLQIVTGYHLDNGSHRAENLQRTGTLVVICGLLGIARVWELMGAPP
ncbi:hypothetical protein GCM10025867_16370 [Frondihabitans sucicola]|uniref:Uncharacterized protein n=1 Tax=Frondihabitans sucicola TaxID=1268041 RepID=A0ABM8GLX0_9MICO|nr:hypothetical protein [Frondihabitans sucicola]BDZ49396.1 hypothetical protein GCM10025867_16370 [Frondihabitans sucicola]